MPGQPFAKRLLHLEKRRPDIGGLTLGVSKVVDVGSPNSESVPLNYGWHKPGLEHKDSGVAQKYKALKNEHGMASGPTIFTTKAR